MWCCIGYLASHEEVNCNAKGVSRAIYWIGMHSPGVESMESRPAKEVGIGRACRCYHQGSEARGLDSDVARDGPLSLPGRAQVVPPKADTVAGKSGTTSKRQPIT